MAKRAMERSIELVILAACFMSCAALAGDGNAEFAALETAAARGDPKAQMQIAMRYENAEGVQKDFRKANRFYCLAARQGDAEGQFRLGWAYANARGLARDDGVAAALFLMAKQQGHEYAARLLQYVRPQADPRMPSCLLPDPPAEENEISIADGVLAGNSSGANYEVRRQIELLVRKLAPKYGIDPRLALAIISVESAFNQVAVSPKNAQGLMQLIPETAARFGVNRIMDPSENIKGGLAYLRWLLAFFQGNVPLAVAAYNAGERTIEKYRGIPPYAETRAYVRNVTSMYRRFEHPYDPSIVQPSPVMARLNFSRH